MALHARGLSFQEELACDVKSWGNSELVALLFFQPAVKRGKICLFRRRGGDALQDGRMVPVPDIQRVLIMPRWIRNGFGIHFYVGEPSRSRAIDRNRPWTCYCKELQSSMAILSDVEIGEGRILFEVLFPAALKNEN